MDRFREEVVNVYTTIRTNIGVAGNALAAAMEEAQNIGNVALRDQLAHELSELNGLELIVVDIRKELPL